MDTAEVEVFLVLAEELHFGRTGERLRLPQPRVSRLIARLDRRAGGALFDRTNRLVRLTPLGEQLRAQLGPAYAQLTAALDSARAASRGVTGQLRVGFTTTTPSEPLTRLVQTFEMSHPECQVTLHEHSITGDDWDMGRPLRAGESDALVYWNGTEEPDLTAGPVIAWLDRVLLVARGHRLASRETVSVEELATERLMERPPTAPQDLMDMLIPPVTPSGRPIRRTEPVQSFHELVSLVARGRIVHPTGAGVLPARRTDIVQIPISDLPSLPMGLIWCTAHENARIRALAATAASIAPPVPPAAPFTPCRR
ncbi:MAG: LysR family transcriptional regulator [Streptosporangiaceae bacterium]